MSNERLQLVCTNFSAYDCSYLYGLDGQMKSELFKLVFQFRVDGMELFFGSNSAKISCQIMLKSKGF